MPTLSTAQRARVERAVRKHTRRDPDVRGELNVVPFLDIVMNVLMFALATMATVFTATIRPAEAASPGPTMRRDQVLTVHIVANGYVVSATQGFAARGCGSLVAGGDVSVPLRDGAHDADGLRACLVRLKRDTLAAELAGQRRIQVSTAGSVTYQELVRALDAVRGSGPGVDDLFPDAALGIVR